MGLNLDKPNKWKEDIRKSVDMYNSWFMRFAPEAFRTTRTQTTVEVAEALKRTDYLFQINPGELMKNPGVLRTLRMSTCPPIAVDRLIGLSGANPTFIKKIESEGKFPERMQATQIRQEFNKITGIIQKLLDRDIFPWLEEGRRPKKQDLERAATVIADRLCGAIANPIIRNAQEKRQLKAIEKWLKARGYTEVTSNDRLDLQTMRPGTFAFRLNVPVKMGTGNDSVNIPIDAVIRPKTAKSAELPILIEAKSAGDFANVNKRRKEEAQKIAQLRGTYGKKLHFVLFLCGYFDSGYLGYEAAEGIDWIWEHEINDLAYFVGK